MNQDQKAMTGLLGDLLFIIFIAAALIYALVEDASGANGISW